MEGMVIVSCQKGFLLNLGQNIYPQVYTDLPNVPVATGLESLCWNTSSDHQTVVSGHGHSEEVQLAGF